MSSLISVRLVRDPTYEFILLNIHWGRSYHCKNCSHNVEELHVWFLNMDLVKDSREYIRVKWGLKSDEFLSINLNTKGRPTKGFISLQPTSSQSFKLRGIWYMCYRQVLCGSSTPRLTLSTSSHPAARQNVSNKNVMKPANGNHASRRWHCYVATKKYFWNQEHSPRVATLFSPACSKYTPLPSLKTRVCLHKHHSHPRRRS